MQTVIHTIRQAWEAWMETGKILLRASPRFFIGLLVLSLIAGSMLSYGLTLIANFLDAVIGARGTQVLTGDVIQYGRRLCAVFFVWASSITILFFVRGKARQWTYMTLEVSILLAVSIILLPVALIRLPVQILLTLIPVLFDVGRWRFVIAGSIIAMTLAHFSALIQATVYRDLTVGVMVMFILADVLLLGWSIFRGTVFR